MMTSPIRSESGDSFDKPYHGNSKRHGSLFHSGVLLLEDAERAPEYLRLTIDSDPDEPDPMKENESDEEDVVVLGEKRPTYQEITLEEDDEGEVKEKVVEIEKPEPPPKTPEEPIYECTYCDKSFRVESLLKFHIKMHNSSAPAKSKEIEPSPSGSCSTINSDVDNKPKKKRRSLDDDDEEESRQKVNSITRLKQKVHRGKHKSHKHKKGKRSESS